MSTNKLTIVPVKLNPLPTKTSSFNSSQHTAAPSCIIKNAVAEIAFFNGVDEHHYEGAEKPMKHDFTSVQNIYIICGKTDMRKGIDGLATLIQDSFELDPYSDSIFLFSGWSKDRYKCLYFDGDGFAMLYKRLDNGKLQWPKDENEVRNLSQQELRWLLEGLSLQQPKAIAKSAKGVF